MILDPPKRSGFNFEHLGNTAGETLLARAAALGRQPSSIPHLTAPSARALSNHGFGGKQMPAEALPTRRARLSLPKPPAPSSPGSSPRGGRASWGPSNGVCSYSPFRKKQLKSQFLDKKKRKKETTKTHHHRLAEAAQIYSRGGRSHRPWACSAGGWEPTRGTVAEMAG